MDDELRPEYDLSQLLKNGVRGKYAEQYQAGTNKVAHIYNPCLVHFRQAADFNKEVIEELPSINV